MRPLFVVMMTMIFFSSAAYAAEQLSASDMKTAIQLNKAYARHMYASSCVERQRMMMSPILTPAEKNGLMVGFQKSCDCLADGLLKDNNPNDVIGYVTYINGSIEPGTKKAKPDAQTKEKNAKIMSYAFDKRNRSACGFKQ